MIETWSLASANYKSAILLLYASVKSAASLTNYEYNKSSNLITLLAYSTEWTLSTYDSNSDKIATNP